jgi:hypothetical protein
MRFGTLGPLAWLATYLHSCCPSVASRHRGTLLKPGEHEWANSSSSDTTDEEPLFYSSSSTVCPSPPGTICTLVSKIALGVEVINTMQMLLPLSRIFGSLMLPSAGSLKTLLALGERGEAFRGFDIHLSYILKNHVCKLISPRHRT